MQQFINSATANPYSTMNSVTINPQLTVNTTMRAPLRKGMTVRIIPGKEGDYPLSPGEPAIIVNDFQDGSYHAKNHKGQDFLLNGKDIDYGASSDGSSQRGGKKPKKFDLKELEPLVVSPEVMEEIKAVLKQQENGKKMFDDWGLGEVIEYGRGMTFLFYGPPGTGKTWAATCMAKVFGSGVISIGAAEIQTSEPGGANRNIQNAFKSAKEEGKVLFLDECDSLITSRSEVGMILGGEINTLLTEIEKFEGVVILATNRIENMDEALERRISLIVEFPHPTFVQREQIWQRLLPKKMPLASNVTPLKLAEYNLTGGQIKNVVLQAARLAIASESKKVELSHFESAITRVNKSKSLMGSASRYRSALVREDFKKGATT